MKRKKIPNVSKILLSALKSQKGITVGYISMIGTIPTYSCAYQTAMYATRRGLLEKIEDRFYITENGKQRLLNDRLISIKQIDLREHSSPAR